MSNIYNLEPPTKGKVCSPPKSTSKYALRRLSSDQQLPGAHMRPSEQRHPCRTPAAAERTDTGQHVAASCTIISCLAASHAVSAPESEDCASCVQHARWAPRQGHTPAANLRCSVPCTLFPPKTINLSQSSPLNSSCCGCLQVTLKTTIGDLDIELWPKEAPKVRVQLCSSATATNTCQHVWTVLQDAAVHSLQDPALVAAAAGCLSAPPPHTCTRPDQHT